MNRKNMVLSFILLFIFSIMVGLINGAVPQKERAALIALYNNTKGDKWTNKSGWKTPPLHSDGFALPGTEDNWYGVICNDTSTNILKIELGNNKLKGSIPSELGNLSRLAELDLHNNQLTGAIPSELENISRLQYLYLDSNRLNGCIPSELGNLRGLIDLSLYSNFLEGPIPPELGNLSELVYLDLHSNRLIGNIPQILEKLSNLEYLDLYNNQLTGYIPPELGNLSKLESLNLNENQLTGSIPWQLGNLSSLYNLNLSGNQLKGPIPPELKMLSNLEYLILNNNQLTGPIPAELGNLTKLFNLKLGFNQLSENIPLGLEKLTNLQYLDLSSNRLMGNIPIEIGQLEKLCESNSDFRWNGLYTDNESLREFLNKKQIGNDWESTQTIAPKNVVARTISINSIEISWVPINYIGDEIYKIFYSEVSGKNYTLFSPPEVNYNYRMEVKGLKPFTRYYFVVQTQTGPHEFNQNTLVSGFSNEVSEETQEPYKTISGRVATDTGKGIDGVRLFFTPSNTFTETDNKGNYSHIVDLYWEGKVKPEKTGYIFEPGEISFTSVTSNKPGTNFTAKPIPLSICGKVKSFNDEGIEGVTLTITPGDKENRAETNADGRYSYQVPYGWTGTVTPSKGDLLFYPHSITYNSVIGNKNNEDYQLSISFPLFNVDRQQDKTMIISKEYGDIKINVKLKENATPAVQKFKIYRKESNGSFSPIQEYVIQEQKNSYEFTYRDEYLEKGKTYIYIVRAIDLEKKIIGESKEKTI